jgi:hypothetical protein
MIFKLESISLYIVYNLTVFINKIRKEDYRNSKSIGIKIEEGTGVGARVIVDLSPTML